MRGDAAAHDLARDVDRGVTRAVEVGAVGDRIRVEPRVPPRLARGLDPPRQPVRLGAEREHHPIGVARGDADHARAGGGHLERHPIDVADPRDPARLRSARESQLLERRRGRVAHLDVLERHRLAREIAAQVAHVALERGETSRRATEVGQRRVAAPDRHHRAAVRDPLHAGDGARGRRRLPGRRVGDARTRGRCDGSLRPPWRARRRRRPTGSASRPGRRRSTRPPRDAGRPRRRREGGRRRGSRSPCFAFGGSRPLPRGRDRRAILAQTSYSTSSSASNRSAQYSLRVLTSLRSGRPTCCTASWLLRGPLAAK